jgi:hypothetical protein
MAVMYAPPRPFEREELEALIEEARRRTRRRRLAYLLAILLAAGAVGAIWAGLALTAGGGTTAGLAPPGFHLVKARGPVAHLLIETRSVSLTQPTSIDLATGRERPARTTSEVWLDRRSGLARVVMRVDGRTQWDQVGTCSPEWTEPNCLPAFAPSGQWVREPGRDVFHGGEIIWFGKRQGEVTWLGKHYDGYPPAPSEGEHVGLDPRTHEPVAFRNYDEGALIAESWVRQRKPDVAAGRLSLAVPDGEIEGYLRQSARTAFSADGVSTPFAARARRALARAPLWLGPSFRDHPLLSVKIGSEFLEASTGARLRSARFVRFNYENFSLEEFGSERPSWYEEGPRPGRVILERLGGWQLGARPGTVGVFVSEARAAVSRGGVLVVVTAYNPGLSGLDGPGVRALAKALRPLTWRSRR